MARLSISKGVIVVLLCLGATTAWAQTTVGPIAVAANGDDGHEDSAGVTSNSQTITPSIDNTNEWGYWRFTGITVTGSGTPGAVTVSNAFLTFCVGAPGNDEPDVTIYGYDVNNPSNPSFGTNNVVSGLTRTTASAAWQNLNLGGGSGCVDYNTADISSVVQELVDSYTFSSSAMAFVLTHTGANDGTRDLVVVMKDDAGATGNPARLTFTYTAAGGGTSATKTLLLLGVGEP